MNSAISRAVPAHRPRARVGVIELDVEALVEAEAKQPVRGVERRLDQPVELQIGLDLALIEIELGLAPFLGVIAPVPRREAEIAALPGDDRLQRLFFPLRAQNARRPDGLQQIERGVRRLRHCVGQAKMGEARIAEEARALGAQADHFGGDGAIVRFAAILAARGPGAEGFFAQIAPRRELQERLDAGARKRDAIFARMAALGRRARGAFDEKIRQALEIARVQEQQEGFFVGQHILAELRAKARQPLGDLGEARLLLRRKPRAGAREVSMVAFEHARLLFIQTELFFTGLQRFDAGETALR